MLKISIANEFRKLEIELTFQLDTCRERGKRYLMIYPPKILPWKKKIISFQIINGRLSHVLDDSWVGGYCSLSLNPVIKKVSTVILFLPIFVTTKISEICETEVVKMYIILCFLFVGRWVITFLWFFPIWRIAELALELSKHLNSLWLFIPSLQCTKSEWLNKENREWEYWT